MEQIDMTSPLKFSPIGEVKEVETVKRNVSRIQKVEQARVKKSRITLSLKKFALVASLGSVIGVTSLYGVKTGIGNVVHQYQVEKEFNTLKDDAQELLRNNSNMVLKEKDGENVWEAQYDHFGIAQAIKKFETNYGEVSASALTATLMNSIEESGYQNMDSIIRYLTDNENSTNVDDYIHSQGYETEEAYQQAMKEAYYDEIQKEEVRAKYVSNEGRSR